MFRASQKPRCGLSDFAVTNHNFLLLASKKAPKVEAPAEDKQKGNKKRVKRDKDAPKKPMAPFFCYQAKRRPQLKTEQPSLKNTEIIKVSA